MIAPRWTFCLFDAAGRCLYVGTSATHPKDRIQAMRARNGWARRTVRTSIEKHPTAVVAQLRRIELIRQHPPIHGRAALVAERLAA